MDKKVRQIINKFHGQVSALYGERLERVVIFGSQARGDAMPDSDIDVLIVLKHPFDYLTESNSISECVATLSLQHNVVISCAFSTKEQFSSQNNGFFRNIRKEGITL
jgi:predicted nucleotidyltransferase